MASAGSGRDNPIPLEWGEALSKHLEMMRADGASKATLDSHDYRIHRFLDWLMPSFKHQYDEPDAVTETTDLRRKHLQDYKLKRSNEVAKTTVKTEMDTIRVFLRNLEGYGALPDGMHQFARSPELDDGEGRRSHHLPVERGDTIREYLRSYEWASERHVLFEIIWSTGMRLGAAHGIDVGDVHVDEGRIELRHRPNQGTTLKNGGSGERDVTIHETVAEAISDYLDRPERPDDVEDEYGRVPLFCQEAGDGRRGKQYLRDLTYSVTRPCLSTGECPHDRDIEECDAASSKNKSYECPSSMATHALRSGALTRMMKNEVPPWAVSRRVDCSEDVLEEHYVELDEDEKAETLRDYFENDYE